jgi:hypothetical protein
LSLRAALRLIAKTGNADRKPSKKKAPQFDALAWWKSAPHEERTRLLAAIGLLGLLAALPPDMRSEIERRAKRAKPESGDEHATSTKILHTALSHLVLSQNVAALNALRGMTRIHDDFHTLTVHVSPVQEAQKRRAA